MSPEEKGSFEKAPVSYFIKNKKSVWLRSSALKFYWYMEPRWDVEYICWAESNVMDNYKNLKNLNTT